MKTLNKFYFSKAIFISLIVVCIICQGQAQELKNASDFEHKEPLAGLSDISTSHEIYILWGQDNLFKNEIVDYLPTAQQDISLLENTISDVYAPSVIRQGDNINETTRVAVTAADLEGDGRDDIVKVTTTESGELILSVTSVLPELNVSGNSVNLQIPTNVALETRLNIHILGGNFDNDIEEEVALIWPESGENSTNKIQVRIYNWENGSLKETANFSYQNSVIEYSVELTDLDLNGLHELALATVEMEDQSPVIVVNILGMEVGELLLVSKKIIQEFDNQTPFSKDVSLAINTGDYDGDVANELALVYRQKRDNVDVEIIQLRLIQSLDIEGNSTESVFETLRIVNNQLTLFEYSGENIPEYQNIYAASGDVNGDGDADLTVYSPSRDLLLFTALDSLEVSQVNDFTDFLKGNTLKPVFCFTRGGLQSLGIQMADLDRDGIEELVFAGLKGCTDDLFSNNMTNSKVSIEVYDLRTGAPELTGITNIENSNTSFFGRAAASFVLGDFDADNLRLGKGQYSRRSEISQPLIILNAPPIHFDQLQNELYDINECYQNSDCSFASNYLTSSSVSMQTSTTVSSAWGVSANVRASAGVDVELVKSEISASVSARYGEGFSKYRSSGKRLDISTQVSAIEDDQIYAMVTDYDIWEYPVYKNDSLVTHLVSIVPTVTERRWFPSKSYNAYDYLPDHEVGNILSYRTQKPDYSRVDQIINSDNFTLSENSQSKWVVNQQSFRESGSSRVREFGIGASLDIQTDVNFKIFGGSLGATISGEYETSDLTTQRTSISDELELEIELGGVDESLGEVKYAVNPYCYWAKNGALVVDYTAEPEVPAPGAPDTWWSFHYGQKADPALILPWKYDPEKGLSLQDEIVKRFQSKSIGFSNSKPLPGDTITIYTEVHNWSLLPTTGPVEVGFYLCDPGQETNRMTGIHGETTVSTIQKLDPRGNDIVSFEWKVPDNLSTFPRIYARIDPNNKEGEIHENNNYGFAILDLPTANGNCPPPSILTNNSGSGFSNPKQVLLYPNPVNSLLSVSFDSILAGTFNVDIYNQMGQIALQQSGRLDTTGHPSLPVNVSSLPSGMYFFRLQSNGNVYSGKFVKE